MRNLTSPSYIIMDQILLNNSPYKVSKSLLPCLISYANKTGGSHFSLTLLAQLCKAGEKVILFTAFPMAKDNFVQQMLDTSKKVTCITTADTLDHDADALIVDSGNQTLFLSVLETIALDDYVILIKNMEYFSDEVLYSCLARENIIFSGDIDSCRMQTLLLEKQYAATIFFSHPSVAIAFSIPALKQYEGWIHCQDASAGILTVSMQS